MKKGFTLVELSIVLVIIGLLIGGILVAQSLIQTARIHAMVKQMQQFEIVLNNFKEHYRQQIPGDSPFFYMSGNGNGEIEDGSGVPQMTNTFTGELANYWPSLQLSGMLGTEKGTYTESMGMEGFRADGPNPNTPAAAMQSEVTGHSIGIVPAMTNMDSIYVIAYLYADFNSTPSAAANLAPVNSFRCLTILSIDLKMDNGDINSGNIQINDGVQYGFNGALDGNLSNCEEPYGGVSNGGQNIVVKVQAVHG